jgi:ribosomal protein S27AE
MADHGQCAKCGSAEIARVEGAVGEGGAGNNIFTGWTSFSAVKVTRYVCVTCGYIEEWVDDPDDLERIRKAFL